MEKMKFRIKDPEVRKALEILGYQTEFVKDSPYLRSDEWDYWFLPDRKGRPIRVCIALGLFTEEIEPVEEEVSNGSHEMDDQKAV